MINQTPVKPGSSSYSSTQTDGQFIPPAISRIEDTGLSPLWIQDLALKIIYYQGYMTGFKIAEDLALPFAGLVDQILDILKREKLIEVKTSQMGLGEGSYQYGITGAGIAPRSRSPGTKPICGACTGPVKCLLPGVFKTSTRAYGGQQ